MNITLTPQRRDDTLVVSKAGNILTINNIPYDFSVIPDGASLPAGATDCPFITGEIERIAGVLHISLLLPHGSNPSQVVAFPVPIINPIDGLLGLPQ